MNTCEQIILRIISNFKIIELIIYMIVNTTVNI